MNNATHLRRQQLEEMETLAGNIKAALLPASSNLKKIDTIATLLEGFTFELDETILADIMLSVFKAGKIAGKDELKQEIVRM